MIEWLEKLDAKLLLKINGMHHPMLDELMWFFSLSWPTYLIAFCCALIFYRKYTLKAVVAFLLGCALVAGAADITANLFKHNVKRFRPTHNLELKEKVRVVRNYYGGQYGFFSGHSATTWSVVIFIFLALSYLKRNWRYFLLLYAILVMYSRMYLAVHYPSDVISGMVCGILYGYLGYQLFHRWFFHNSIRES